MSMTSDTRQQNGLTMLVVTTAMKSALAPLEFGAEDAEEAVGSAAQKANARLRTLTVDVVVKTKGDRLLTVDGEVDLVGNADDMNADGGFAGGDDGSDGQQVGTDGSDEHGVDAGHDDGAIGGEVVGGRTGGGGDDDAVGAEGGDELAVDFDGEVAHAGDGALGDDHVVEGVPFLNDFAVADVLGVHHAADLDLGAVIAPGFEGCVQVREGNLGKEAEGAEIHTEDWGGGAGEGAGRGEQSAVSTEDDDEVRLVFWQIDAFDGAGSSDVGGAVGVEKVMVVACFEPRDEIAQDAGNFRLLGLGDDGGLEH
jgi:hypothetical protein